MSSSVGLLRRGRECQREPLQALRAQLSAVLAGNDGIDGDDAQLVFFDRVLDERRKLVQIGVIGKCRAQRFAVVVIAGDQIHRHRQRRDDFAQQRVLLRLAAVDEIAGHHDDIGLLRQRLDVRDAASEVRCRVDDAVCELAARHQVHIAHLADDH
jgi:hypothetical protein